MIAILLALTAGCEPTMNSPAMFIVTTDSMATVTVCLAATHRVASYHAVLRWDTSAATLDRIDHPQRGRFAENVETPGRVDFAGSNGAGFDRGPVLSVHLHSRDGQPATRLEIVEMTGVYGRHLITARAPWPHIESIAPDTLPVGSTAQITIRGRHFAPDSNRVDVGPARVAGVPSSEHGSLMRIVVPVSLPSSGETPPIRLGPTTYPIRITTRAGSSNVVPFTLVERAP